MPVHPSSAPKSPRSWEYFPPPPPSGPQPVPEAKTNRRPEVLGQLHKFWQRVTEGLELNQLWSQFHADARASYRLYSRDFEARAPQGTRRHNFLNTAQEFIWAILEKLTPARRVLLLVGVLLVIFPAGGFNYQGKSGVEVVEFDFHFYGGVLLFILLMLEVADRVVMKRDLEIARYIQSWLLPANAPQVPGLEIEVHSQAAASSGCHAR